MSRKIIELVQVLVDRIHQGGYTQRALEDDIYAESQKRIAAENDRDAARAEIETLRKQLADAEHPPAMAQQRDEIAYLRTRLEEERSVIAGLRQQLDAAHADFALAESGTLRHQLDMANAAVTLQRTRIERQRRVVDKVRQMLFKPNRDIEYGDINGLRAALADFEAGTEPAIDGDALAEGVTKVCQEITDGRKAKEIERLRAFVGRVRELLQIPLDQIGYDDMAIIRAELAALDAEGGA